MNAVPLVAVAGAATTKCVAAALTLIGLLAPVMVVSVESVAVNVWVPAVAKVAEKVP